MIAIEVRYKKTGIDWLEEIPEHWSLLRFKNVYKECSGNGFPNNLQGETSGDMPFLKVSDINGDSFYVDKSNNWVSKKVVENNRWNVIPKGTIIAAKIGEALRKNHRKILLQDSLIDNNCIGFYPLLLSEKYSFYLLKLLDLDKFSNPGAVPSVSLRMLRPIKLPIPTFEEQKAIADYLDNQSAKLTHFIQTKQRFIELLKEQRQSIVTNAVTKGIGENVKMKESGIEWMGKVPEHWEIRRLRYVGQCQNGINKGGEYFGKGFPFVGYTDVYKNEIIPSTLAGLAISSKEDQLNYSVTEGDVFFTRTSETAEEIAISAVCLDTIPNATFSGFLIRFRPLKGILHPGFSKYYFRCNVHRAYFVKEMLIVTRASLSQNLLNNLPILIPPISEQKEIEAFINNETQTLDIAISKAEREIELIKEYREAMIAEAVTGKMKL